MPVFKISKPLLFKPFKMSASASASASAPRRSGSAAPAAAEAVPAMRRSNRAAAAAEAAAAEAAKPKPISVEEIRGVTVTTWAPPSGVVVSEGVYSTYRYRDRLSAAGGKWVAAEQAWHLPAGSDVRAVLAPPAAPPAAAGASRPSWVCCEKAKILSHKNEHYSCSEHTMYWEDCPMPDGRVIKILYSSSTKGGGCYTGT